ncbi:hypothetical protein FKM82_023542 [Ascaphus truei]
MEVHFIKEYTCTSKRFLNTLSVTRVRAKTGSANAGASEQCHHLHVATPPTTRCGNEQEIRPSCPSLGEDQNPPLKVLEVRDAQGAESQPSPLPHANEGQE